MYNLRSTLNIGVNCHTLDFLFQEITTVTIIVHIVHLTSYIFVGESILIRGERDNGQKLTYS